MTTSPVRIDREVYVSAEFLTELEDALEPIERFCDETLLNAGTPNVVLLIPSWPGEPLRKLTFRMRPRT